MIATVNQLRKEGKLKEAYAKAENQLKENKDHAPYKEDMLWVFYAYLKKYVETTNINNVFKVVGKVCELNMTHNKMFNESLNWQLIKLINNKQLREKNELELIAVLKKCEHILSNQEPSNSKSVLIKMMLKHLKTKSGFWTIFDFLDKKQYQSTDFKPEEYKGKKIMALYEQALYATLKSWMHDAMKGDVKALSLIDKIISLLDNIEKPYQYKFLRFYQVKVLLIAQRVDDANKKATEFLRTSMDQFYAWTLLSDCTNDAKQKIAYLTKALDLQRNKKYSVGILKSLMDIYTKQQDYDMASAMAKQIIKIRQSQDWPIKTELYKVALRGKKHLGSESVKSRMSEAANRALTYCFENAVVCIAVVTGAKADAQMYYLQDSEANTYKVRMARGLKVGQFVELVIDKKVVSAKPVKNPIKVEGAIKYFKGSFKPIKEFGFIKNIFVTPKLCQKLTKGEIKQGVAVKEVNKKTKKQGWRVLCFYE